MNKETFRERADALENAFFADVDAKLMDNLRASLEKDKSSDELAALSGISDRTALESLVNAGVTGRSLTALHIFPLVAVAWADNVIQDSERERILLAAADQGFEAGSPAATLLDQWLQHKPDESVFAAWEAYAKALVSQLDRNSSVALCNSIEKEIRGVAESAGGVLGWAAVSRGESAVMDRIMKALQTA